jgi:hypothetical protein
VRLVKRRLRYKPTRRTYVLLVVLLGISALGVYAIVEQGLAAAKDPTLIQAGP